MKMFRTGLIPFAALAVSLLFQHPARADVRTIRPIQTLAKPANPSWQHFGMAVAIDGPHIIVLALNEGAAEHTYAALLYRRNSSGRWVYRRTLVTATGDFARMDVRMKSGIAVVNFGGQVSLFETVAGDYVPARTAAPIRHPGSVDISADSVLIGGDNCDYDAVVYQKGANGIWGITGRLDDNVGECEIGGLVVELNFDYALLRSQRGRVASAWRRNGTAINWVPAGVLTLPPDTGVSEKPYTLQGATAVANNGLVFRRSGTSTWTLQGKATSVDHDDVRSPFTFEAVYRDGVLLTAETSALAAYPRIYLEASPGRFEHVASLNSSLSAMDAWSVDISGRTAVVAVRNVHTFHWAVDVFNLPAQLRAPSPIVNHFEDRNASDFNAISGQFQLATRGSNDVLAQTNATGLAVALATQSDWTDYQRVESTIAKTFGGTGSWVGLVARYADANNFYYAAIRPDGTFGVYKRVNGVDTLLREGTHYQPTNAATRAALIVDGAELSLELGTSYFPIGTDRSLLRGRAGLATWRARADFDNVHVAGAIEHRLFGREWDGFNPEIDLTIGSGDWQIPYQEPSDEGSDGYYLGLQQRDMSGDARAYTGTPVENMEIVARVRLDAFGAGPQSAWFGLMARYVDARNFYYVTVRRTGQIDIRKQVDGVVTVLASANFVPVPGRQHEFQFRVINDQLQVFVDSATVPVMSAHDGAIPRGQYGLATYRTAVTWDALYVTQP